MGICDQRPINSIAIRPISWCSLKSRAVCGAVNLTIVSEMADEAFALSPISARAAGPREEDYEAIREAFMETSRGRWFLGEYAKRNRNADTSMVLEAVARIEQSLAAQRQPAVDSRLPEALAAIRLALDEASANTRTRLEAQPLEESIAPIRKGLRVIREISWRWREIGADGRICDILDSQANSIEESCEQLGQIDFNAAIENAFALIRDRIDGISGDEVSPDAVSSELAAAPGESEMSTAPTRGSPPTAMDEAPASAAPAEAVPEAGAFDGGATATAQDDAVLDLIAMEMGAADETDYFDPTTAGGIFTGLYDDLEWAKGSEAAAETVVLAEPVAASPTEAAPPVATTETPAAAIPVTLATNGAAEQAAAPAPTRAEAPAPTTGEAQPSPSLGSSLIASGLIPSPRPANDPLAPIRRMSQAERIAFFS